MHARALTYPPTYARPLSRARARVRIRARSRIACCSRFNSAKCLVSFRRAKVPKGRDQKRTDRYFSGSKVDNKEMADP